MIALPDFDERTTLTSFLEVVESTLYGALALAFAQRALPGQRTEARRHIRAIRVVRRWALLTRGPL